MTLSPVTLENFEDDKAQAVPESSDFKRGYEAGRAAAIEARESATARAIQELSSTLHDMNFGYEEARLHLMGKLRPLLTQLSEIALPEILHLSFGAHLNELVETHFDGLAEECLAISVAPEVANRLKSGLSSGDPRFVFVPDTSLDAGQAIIKGGDTHVMLDLPDLLKTLQTALSGLETLQGAKNHG